MVKILKNTLATFVQWTKIKVRIHVKDAINFYFHEREIWWSCLGVNVDYEQDGKNDYFERPVLVLKKFNRHVLWALPITSKRKNGKYYFNMRYKDEDYQVILSQLRLLSSKRLTRKIRTISKKEFDQIRDKVRGFI